MWWPFNDDQARARAMATEWLINANYTIPPLRDRHLPPSRHDHGDVEQDDDGQSVSGIAPWTSSSSSNQYHRGREEPKVNVWTTTKNLDDVFSTCCEWLLLMITLVQCLPDFDVTWCLNKDTIITASCCPPFRLPRSFSGFLVKQSNIRHVLPFPRRMSLTWLVARFCVEVLWMLDTVGTNYWCFQIGWSSIYVAKTFSQLFIFLLGRRWP